MDTKTGDLKDALRDGGAESQSAVNWNWAPTKRERKIARTSVFTSLYKPQGDMEYFPILKLTSIGNYDKRSDRRRDRALFVTSHQRQAKPGLETSQATQAMLEFYELSASNGEKRRFWGFEEHNWQSGWSKADEAMQSSEIVCWSSWHGFGEAGYVMELTSAYTALAPREFPYLLKSV